MADDKSTNPDADGDLITLEDEYEVRDWTMSFRCTEVELRAVVQAVGNSASKVRAYFEANAAQPGVGH